MTPARFFAFSMVVTIFTFANLGCIVSQRFERRCPPWAARSLNRFCGALWLVMAFLNFDLGDRVGAGINLLCVTGAVFTWNYPKDDELPRRRKRRRLEKKTEAPTRPNWTGAQIPENT